MGTKIHPFIRGILYIVSGGVVLFAAVIAGLQVGYAIRGNGGAVLKPENLPNETTLRPGDQVPPLPVISFDGRRLSLRDINRGQATIVGAVIPGCDPCKDLLALWRETGIVDGRNNFRVVLLATAVDGHQDQEPNLGPLAEFQDQYPVYFCSHIDLREQCGLTLFPSVIGIGADNTVKFVTSSYLERLDAAFFDRHL